MGDKTGIFYGRSARIIGISEIEYRTRVCLGEKWCIRCCGWHKKSEFGSDKSQTDGLNQSCRFSYRVKVKNYRATRGTTGMKLSEATREKMSNVRLGDKNHNWKGGITPAARRFRQSAKYQQWRRAVLSRDKCTCQECGIMPARPHAHHIKPVLDFPELALNIDNGATVCSACHINIHVRRLQWPIKNKVA